MWATVQMTKANCERIVRNQGRKLECEVWHQRGSGTHRYISLKCDFRSLNSCRFDMMGKRLYKTYHNLTNIIVRISDGTNSGKKHALLVNAHLDSTLPSPGAADDALAVGVMVECMRVLVETPRWSPKHAIIFRTSVSYTTNTTVNVGYSLQQCRRITPRWFSFVRHPTFYGFDCSRRCQS